MIKKLVVRVGMGDTDVDRINRELAKNKIDDDDIITINKSDDYEADIYVILYKSREGVK